MLCPVYKIHDHFSCQAAWDLALVIQLQVAEGHSSSMTTVAWSKLQLFDQYNRLQSGHWRLPLRVTPTHGNMNSTLLNTVPQVVICLLEHISFYNSN